MKKLLAFLTVSITLIVLLVSWDNDKGQGMTNEKNASLEISADDQRRMVDHFQTLYNADGGFKTKVVKVKVSDILSVIDGLDGNETLDLFFGAYQEQDLERYRLKYPEMISVTDLPTLIIGNATKYSENHLYYDFGNLCPPPPDCNVSYE